MFKVKKSYGRTIKQESSQVNIADYENIIENDSEENIVNDIIDEWDPSQENTEEESFEEDLIIEPKIKDPTKLIYVCSLLYYSIMNGQSEISCSQLLALFMVCTIHIHHY